MTMNILKTYKSISKIPLGKFLFNKGIGIIAPFFGKIHPDIIELNPSRCVVRMKDRRSVRNHIGSVNAGAMCTLIELTGGMAVDASIPSHLRWIPKGMTVSYLAKAKGVLEAVCEVEGIQIEEGEIVLPVSIKNLKNREVCIAEITFYISKKKK